MNLIPRLMIVAIGVLTLGGDSYADGQRAGTLTLFDEGSEDTALMELRAQAIAHVKARDLKSFRGLWSSDVRSSVATEDGGAERLINRLRLDQSGSQAWKELEVALSFGGGFITIDRNIFVMPYVAASRNIRIEFGWCVAMGWVPAYESPSGNAKEITTLNGDLLPVDAKRSTTEWRALTLREGEVGFVRKESCRSGHDLRVYFGKTTGGWRINGIVAGD